MLFMIGTPLEAVKNSDKSYHWVLDNSTKINLASKSTVDKFYRIYLNDVTKMYRYILNPEWGQASGNFRMRYMLISINNDFVFVPLKVIDLMGRGESYISISMEPISEQGNKDNIIQVIKALQEFSCIHYIAVPEDEKKDSIDNNYYNIRSAYENMARGKWKSKHGINILDSLIDFSFCAEQDEGIADDIFLVNQIWDEIKISNKMNNFSFPNKNLDKKLSGITQNDASIYLYSYRYKGKLIGYSIPVKVADKYVVLLSAKQITDDYEVLSKYVGEDTDELKAIYKYISSYMQFKMFQDVFERLNFEAIYIFGDVDIKGLRAFKQKHYKSIIYYNKYSLAEYIERLETL